MDAITETVTSVVMKVSEWTDNGYAITPLNLPGGSTLHSGAARGLMCRA